MRISSTLRLGALSGLALVSVLSHAQKYSPAELREMELEREDMPYMPMPFKVTTPPRIVSAGGFTSIQVNVDNNGMNIVNDAANEPSMAINPLNPSQITVGWRQFDNIQSNFRQGGYGWSSDGGATWRSSKIEPGIFRSDPVLDDTPSGDFQYNSLLTTFFTDQFGSTNGGATWTKLGPATGGDKNWMIVDSVPGSPGNGFAYQIWSTAGNNYGGRQFSRSTNGGSVWNNPINLPNQPVWGTLDVASNGDLYICGCDFGSTFYFLKSTNAKNSAVTPTFTSTTVNMGGSIQYGIPINPDGLGGQVWIAVDRSGGPTNGYIYMLASVRRNTSNPLDVMFTRSTNGGTTWSAPVKVNDDAANGGKYHWFGTLAVAPNGRIDIIWYDTRNSPNNTQSEVRYTSSTDGGLTFAPSTVVSPMFTQGLGYPQQNKLGDYIAMVSDNTGASIAYAATFNGEQDVYYLRVPTAVPTEVLPRSFSLFRGALVSGTLPDLFQADSNYVVVRPGIVVNPAERPVQVVIEGASPSNTPSALQFKLVAKTTTSSVRQDIELFNFQTNAYEMLDQRQSTTSDQTVTVTAAGNLGRFVAGDGTLRAKVGYVANAPTPALWQASLNQTVWTVTP
ncbi:MAG: exo-alpha-sialidase [Fimbriimonadaceae bacterium]|nr:exo-alpha-sialidase [Fimbriimonadaceae bacterium]QYK54731.1 MAG: exo-alpha-sialidase [Fimbriimonadaceae bacterium]